MSLLLLLLLAVALPAAPPAQAVPASPENPSWVGTWQPNNDKTTELTVSLTDETVRVTDAHDGKVVSEYTCKLDGKDCTFTDDGKKATVSVWRNGPKLVEIRTRGGHVKRRRLTANPDGKVLDVEIEDMSPNGKTEKTEYSRTQ